MEFRLDPTFVTFLKPRSSHGHEKSNRSSNWTWVAAIVLVHLVISIVHGTAHEKAHVLLSPSANAFVFAVILAGPLIGLGWMWRNEHTGAWLIALTMAAALIFGFINHFAISSPDHVAHVDPEWRLLFTTTAVLLVITEAVGCGLAFRSVWTRRLG